MTADSPREALPLLRLQDAQGHVPALRHRPPTVALETERRTPQALARGAQLQQVEAAIAALQRARAQLAHIDEYLQRLQELARRAADGVLSAEVREALQWAVDCQLRAIQREGAAEPCYSPAPTQQARAQLVLQLADDPAEPPSRVWLGPLDLLSLDLEPFSLYGDPPLEVEQLSRELGACLKVTLYGRAAERCELQADGRVLREGRPLYVDMEGRLTPLAEQPHVPLEADWVRAHWPAEQHAAPLLGITDVLADARQHPKGEPGYWHAEREPGEPLSAAHVQVEWTPGAWQTCAAGQCHGGYCYEIDGERYLAVIGQEGQLLGVYGGPLFLEPLQGGLYRYAVGDYRRQPQRLAVDAAGNGRYRLLLDGQLYQAHIAGLGSTLAASLEVIDAQGEPVILYRHTDGRTRREAMQARCDADGNGVYRAQVAGIECRASIRAAQAGRGGILEVDDLHGRRLALYLDAAQQPTFAPQQPHPPVQAADLQAAGWQVLARRYHIAHGELAGDYLVGRDGRVHRAAEREALFSCRQEDGSLRPLDEALRRLPTVQPLTVLAAARLQLDAQDSALQALLERCAGVLERLSSTYAAPIDRTAQRLLIERLRALPGRALRAQAGQSAHDVLLLLG